MVNEPHVCDHCGSAFGSAHDKKRHMELAHREEMEAMEGYRCVCGKTFASEQGLKVHCGRAKGVHEQEGDDLDALTATADEDRTSDAYREQSRELDQPVHIIHATFDRAASPEGLYRMELIRTLAELATWQLDPNDTPEAYATVQRIIELAGDER